MFFFQNDIFELFDMTAEPVRQLFLGSDDNKNNDEDSPTPIDMAQMKILNDREIFSGDPTTSTTTSTTSTPINDGVYFNPATSIRPSSRKKG